MTARLFAPGAVADLRAALLASGLLREGAEICRSPARGTGLRLDAAGRAAAARHLREGDHGRRLMRSDTDVRRAFFGTRWRMRAALAEARAVSRV